MNKFKVLNCSICQSKINKEPVVTPEVNPITDIKIKKKLWTNLLNKRIFFPYYRCECGLLTNKYFIEEKTLKHLYSDMKDNVHLSDDINNDIKTKKNYLRQIQIILSDQRRKLNVLEIGADNGSFLKLIQKSNPKVRITAIEPNKRMHKKLKYLTKNVYHDLKKIPKSEKFDLIIAIHVFDHIPNLINFLKSLEKKIKNGGFIYGVVHNERSAMARILGRRWPAYSLQHPHLFNRLTIDNLFKKLKYKKKFIRKTVNFFNLGFLLKHLCMAIFNKKINFPNLFPIGLKLGNFSFLYIK